MSKHRVGDRRIISISIPEDLAVRLDRSVGKGKDGRSATIAKMIDNALNPKRNTTQKKRQNLLLKNPQEFVLKAIQWVI